MLCAGVAPGQLVQIAVNVLMFPWMLLRSGLLGGFPFSGDTTFLRIPFGLPAVRVSPGADDPALVTLPGLSTSERCGHAPEKLCWRCLPALRRPFLFHIPILEVLFNSDCGGSYGPSDRDQARLPPMVEGLGVDAGSIDSRRILRSEEERS